MDFPEFFYLAFEEDGQLVKYTKSVSVPIVTQMNVIRGEEPTGYGVTRYLLHMPIGDIDLFLNGQRLTRNIDYSLTGNAINFEQDPMGILRASYNY